MTIEYKSNKLNKSVESPRAILKNYGTRAKLVNQRLEELKAAKNLSDFKNIPKANCHELTNANGKKDELALDISANHRIIFKPNHDPIPRKEDGGLDWSLVTHIIIIEIGEDYH
jgi:proteic killer suppression protein